MNISIQNNILAMNAKRLYGINTKQNAKKTEKLSSGYQINRAADDAAGLAISEKMRRIIRGLNQGTENAQEGIGWVQTGDGALDEVHDIMHRMTELTVKSLNETYTDDDRELMQVEFDQLQSELDRITNAAVFNEQHIFQEHESPYYQFVGSAVWPQDQLHTVAGGANDLVVEYRLKETDTPVTGQITVPPGVYTTQALIDEIDTALEGAGLIGEGIVLEYTLDGRCNLNLEGGEKVDNVSGGLSYLLYDNFGGGSLGALIGTTIFRTDKARLSIATGYNDEMTFTVVNTDGTSKQVDPPMKIPEGSYTRDELLVKLQSELDKLPGNVKATAYGTGIMLASEESIITGFKGNMFKIDTGAFTYTSVFYDNVQESTVSFTEGTFTGAEILPTGYGSAYAEDQLFTIRDGVNDTLVLKPNGAAQETVIKIPTDPASGVKQYNMSDMINFLNSAITPLGLAASQFPSQDNRFQGIIIKSTHKGVTSEVGLVREKSTAYDTLFVKHDYQVQGKYATYDNETLADITATLKSGSNYVVDGKSVLPLEIQAGVNDQFQLNINGKPHVIQLDAGKYDTVEAIRSQIDKQLNGDAAPADYKGLMTVSVDTSRIKLSGNRTVDAVTVGKVAGNTGYEDIFVGQSPDHRWSTYGNETITNTSVVQPDGTVKITPGRDTLTVYLNGTNPANAVQVKLPGVGDVDKDAIVNAINGKLQDKEEPNKFGRVDEEGDPGQTKDYHFTAAGYKRSSDYPGMPSNISQSGRTEGDPQGIAGEYLSNTAAKVTLSKILPDTVSLGSNRHFECTLNGLGGSQEKRIAFDLDKAEYARGELVAELQNKITAQCGGLGPDRYGGLKVELNSNNQLVFTAGLKGANGAEARGDTTRILCSPATCSFLKGIYETKYPTTMTLSRAINSSVDFGGGQEFVFQFKKPSDAALRDVSVTLTGSYGSGAALADHITAQLNSQGIPVRADYTYVSGYGNRLVFSTTDKADGYQFAFDSKKGGAAAENIFGVVPPGETARKLNYTIPATAARATVGCDVQSGFTIDENHNVFKITIDNMPHEVNLDTSVHDIDSLIDDLNKSSKLGNYVTVGRDGNRLTFTTKSKNGTGSTIKMTYDTGGSSMERIFGKHTVYGATASFNQDGKLVLKSNGKNGTVRVYSEMGGPFQMPDIRTEYPTQTTGRHSNNHSYIQGAPVTLDKNGKVTIDKWNKDLTLRYYNYKDHGGTLQTRTIPSLEEKDYTLSELAAALEDRLGAEFKVMEKDGGIRIEAADPGSTFRFSNTYYSPYASGGFYERILCSPGRRTKEGEPKDVPGGQTTMPPYVVGRKDVRHQTTKIQRGVNDDLGLEFTTGGKTYPLKMTLDSGVYSADALLKHIQEKLDGALEKEGLPKGLIRAGIGDLPTNVDVAGSNDENALHFILSKEVALPGGIADGQRCVIEAVSGTAAFSIFYQTEGDISRAYVAGTKDLSGGVEITDDNGELAVMVDGQSHKIQIPPKDGGGAYTADELVGKINEQLKAGSVPLNATLEDGRLQLMHTKFGKHTIQNVSGSAKNSVFFTEKGSKEENKDIPIQLSSAEDDQVTIDRPVLNTASMRINSVLISRVKYANKALQRLKEATSHVSDVRSRFGAMQNRLEHAVNNNQNKAENTSSAESRIRDADMAKEVMEHSRLNILDQVGMAMMAQANQTSQAVLQLLR